STTSTSRRSSRTRRSSSRRIRRFMRSLRRSGALCLAVAAALAAGCASVRPSPEATRVPGALLLDDLAVPAGVRPYWLTIYPTPQRALYGESLLPMDGAVRVDDSTPGV